jgi:hypothetical protein
LAFCAQPTRLCCTCSSKISFLKKVPIFANKKNSLNHQYVSVTHAKYNGTHLRDNGVQRQGAVAAEQLDDGPARLKS